MNYFLAFIFTFFLAVIFTLFVRRIAWNLRIIDIPNAERKIHKTPIPLLGGLGVFFSFALVLAYYTFFSDGIIGGFISLKSKNGKELKALELPGLWNGAMSDWNTVFVEVPIETFNPVKTVNDLLRTEHQ